MNFIYKVRSKYAAPVSSWALVLMLVFLPYSRTLGTVGILLFVLAAVLIPGPLRIKITWPLLALWVLSLIGLAWTSQQDYGMNLLIRQLPLLLIPLAFGKVPEVSGPMLRKSTWVFTGSLAVASLLTLVLGWLEFQKTGEYKSLFYHDLSGQIGLSALYLSLFVVMASALLIRQIFESETTRTQLILSGFCLLFFLGMLVLLSARASILAWLFLAFFSLIWFWKNPKSRFIKYAIPIVLLIGAAAVFTVPLLRERFQEAINFENRFSLAGFGGGTSFRLAKWESAWKCIQAAPLFGHGTGDVQFVLDQQYKIEGKFQLLDYNAHNQYLQTWLGLGLPGLLLLMASFFTLIRYSKDRFLALAFSGIWGICIFTESMLQTQKGIYFFALFYCLLATVSGSPGSDLPKASNHSPDK